MKKKILAFLLATTMALTITTATSNSLKSAVNSHQVAYGEIIPNGSGGGIDPPAW